MTGAARVRLRLAESVDMLRRVADSSCPALVAQAASVMAGSLRTGGKVLYFGNGGSATDAGHLAAELTGRFVRDRPPLAALSLADQTAAVTAIGNDYGFDDVFARQITGLGRPGDVAIALSTSGTSANVVRGVVAARSAGLATIALTGASGGALSGITDICIQLPSEATARIQEATLHLGHTISELVEAMMFPFEAVDTVFVDRDGTLNVKADGDYIRRPDDIRLLPGVGVAVSRLNNAGIRVIVLTNQRGVARGLMASTDLRAVHDRLRAALAAEGAWLNQIYACTHASGTCACRKPMPGLFACAVNDDPAIDLTRSVMIGDSETDVAAGIAAGAATIRLADPVVDSAADLVVPDLETAVDRVLGSRR